MERRAACQGDGTGFEQFLSLFIEIFPTDGHITQFDGILVPLETPRGEMACPIGINDERTVTRGYRAVPVQPQQGVLYGASDASLVEPGTVVVRIGQGFIGRLIRGHVLSGLQLGGGQRQGDGSSNAEIHDGGIRLAYRKRDTMAYPPSAGICRPFSDKVFILIKPDNCRLFRFYPD